MSGSRLHASPHKREMFKMAVTIDTPITWRTVVRVGLVWAAEYAMLALIEDATIFMKVATVFCSLSILFVLESRSLFTALPARAYKNAILTSLLLYTACVVYAIHIVERKEFIKDELAKLYTEGMNIGVQDEIYVKDDATTQQVEGIARPADGWESKASEWIRKNIGPLAQKRLEDGSYVQPLTWILPQEARFKPNSLRFDKTMNKLSTYRRNLATIIESGAYIK